MPLLTLSRFRRAVDRMTHGQAGALAMTALNCNGRGHRRAEKRMFKEAFHAVVDVTSM